MDLILAALPFFYLQFIGCITPGPNNVMLTASGMNFGYVKTVPHMVGICAGFTVLLLLCTFGVGAAYAAYPPVQTAMKLIGSGYLVYLAYRVLTAGRVGLRERAKETLRPMRFIEAFGFQFINPKDVVFGLTAINLIPPELSLWEKVLIVVFSSAVTCGFSVNVWAVFGKLVAELFRDDKIRRIINIVLALMLLATIPMMFM